MAVKRIVANLAVTDTEKGAVFYQGILGLDLAMDFGWIKTYVGHTAASPQLSIATEGGSGAPVPNLTIEVDNFDAVWRRVMEAGLEVSYGPVTEPWGVRRFFVRDPFGNIVNVMTHKE
jgi:catechol 2,3-dioxygenase-like lactoylglutathione lyase family enzyme